MKHSVKTFTLGILAVFLFLVTPLANAQDEFKGLWEGIDDGDGSSIVVSIADNQTPIGQYEILWRETHFWRCEKKGQGIVRGTAIVNGSGHLVIDAVLECLDGSKGGTGTRVIPTLEPDFDFSTMATTTGSLTLHRISSR